MKIITIYLICQNLISASLTTLSLLLCGDTSQVNYKQIYNTS